MLEIQTWFVFRMHGSNALVKKAAICLLVILLAKMRQHLATTILVAVTSGSRTTCVIHYRAP